MAKKRAIIIGAGPGGLTAAYELLKRTEVVPIVFEESEYIGGISRTVVFKGNRIDIGGHRFFSKSERVMDWWLNIMPLERSRHTEGVSITYRGKSQHIGRSHNYADPDTSDRVMLVRDRKSRIYYGRHFFDYPLSPSFDTLRKLGLLKSFRIGLTYAKAALLPKTEPQNLEEFYIQQFGAELYETFFKSYTQKVWGVPCSEISADWGSQRVKGLSLTKAATHLLKRRLLPRSLRGSTETSLIERFLYPKFGPGHMWEEVAKDVKSMGGTIYTRSEVINLKTADNRVTSVQAVDKVTGEHREFAADFVLSTMPISHLVGRLEAAVPPDVRYIGEHLEYREFITVGLLLKKLAITEPDGGLIKDNWIYVQEPGVEVGRIQIFNNWSQYLVADQSTVWIGLEYFCAEGDDLWNMNDDELIALATREMKEMGLVDSRDLLDSTVIRMKKAYPGYFGEYKRLDRVRTFLDSFENLFLIGRNGMHKYNNQDHSMLTAMTAIDNIVAGKSDKSNIWAINADQEYHENKS